MLKQAIMDFLNGFNEEDKPTVEETPKELIVEPTEPTTEEVVEEETTEKTEEPTKEVTEEKEEDKTEEVDTETEETDTTIFNNFFFFLSSLNLTSCSCRL